MGAVLVKEGIHAFAISSTSVCCVLLLLLLRNVTFAVETLPALGKMTAFESASLSLAAGEDDLCSRIWLAIPSGPAAEEDDLCSLELDVILSRGAAEEDSRSSRGRLAMPSGPAAGRHDLCSLEPEGTLPELAAEEDDSRGSCDSVPALSAPAAARDEEDYLCSRELAASPSRRAAGEPSLCSCELM